MVTAVHFMASGLLGRVLHYCCRQPSVASFLYTQDTWCHNQDLNWVPSRYKSQVLPHKPTCVVKWYL